MFHRLNQELYLHVDAGVVRMHRQPAEVGFVVEACVRAAAPLHGRSLRVTTGTLQEEGGQGGHGGQRFSNNNVREREHKTDCVVSSSRIQAHSVCEVDVPHADLLSVVGGGGAWESQQQHVDDGHVEPASARGDPRIVVVADLVTGGSKMGVKSQQTGDAGRKNRVRVDHV